MTFLMKVSRRDGGREERERMLYVIVAAGLFFGPRQKRVYTFRSQQQPKVSQYSYSEVTTILIVLVLVVLCRDPAFFL